MGTRTAGLSTCQILKNVLKERASALTHWPVADRRLGGRPLVSSLSCIEVARERPSGQAVIEGELLVVVSRLSPPIDLKKNGPERRVFAGPNADWKKGANPSQRPPFYQIAALASNSMSAIVFFDRSIAMLLEENSMIPD
jgi:hypothetical protein